MAEVLAVAFPDIADTPQTRVLECIEVRSETADVKTFRFRDTHPDGALRFIAGQAALLSLDIDGSRVERTFSIASSPMRSGGRANACATLDFTIKVKQGSRAARWLHDTLAPGMRIGARYPLGRFHLDALPAAPLALVSAGSGASPLMAMLRTLAAHAPDTDVVWLHAARSAADILFAGELAALQAVMPRLQAIVTLSAPAPGWFGVRGRLSRRTVSALVPDFATRAVYCCGPASFMAGLERIHAAEGTRRAPFHIEHFGPATPDVTPLDPPPDAVSSADVWHATLGARRFGVRDGETVLAAASRQQVVIPCGCASGMCGTCKLRCRSGDVVMQHAGGLSAQDEAGGWILACSSRLRSDVELDF